MILKKWSGCINFSVCILFCCLLFGPAGYASAKDGQGSSSVKTLPPSDKRWALIIGVDTYADPLITSLEGPSNDAKALKDILSKNAGFPESQIIVLSSDRPEIYKPTRAHILKALSDLKLQIHSDGLVLIAFSGHGIAQNGQAFLMPSDAQLSSDIDLLKETSIWLDRLTESIRKLEVKQVVIMIDACRNDPEKAKGTGDNVLTDAYKTSLGTLNKDVNAFAVLYATEIGQRAYIDPIKKQGYFVSAVVDGLKGKAADNENKITLASLVKYLQDTVPAAVIQGVGPQKKQKPFAEIHGFLANELVLSLAPAATAERPAPGGEGIISVISNMSGIIYIDGISKGHLPQGSTRNYSKQAVGKHLVKIQGGTTETKEVEVTSGKISFVSFGVKSPIDTSGKEQVGTLEIQSISNVSGKVFIDNYLVGSIESNRKLTITDLRVGQHGFRIEDSQDSIEGSVGIRANETTTIAPPRRPSAPTGLR